MPFPKAVLAASTRQTCIRHLPGAKVLLITSLDRLQTTWIKAARAFQQLRLLMRIGILRQSWLPASPGWDRCTPRAELLRRIWISCRLVFLTLLSGLKERVFCNRSDFLPLLTSFVPQGVLITSAYMDCSQPRLKPGKSALVRQLHIAIIIPGMTVARSKANRCGKNGKASG